MTRRGLWRSTMADGVANIWGRLEGQSDELGSIPYAHPEWILRYAKFFRGRFLIDMARANTLTDGVCLRTPDGLRLVFYKEDSDGIRLELPKTDGRQVAVAVDAMKPYMEINLGVLDAQSHRIKAAAQQRFGHRSQAVPRFPRRSSVSASDTGSPRRRCPRACRTSGQESKLIEHAYGFVDVRAEILP